MFSSANCVSPAAVVALPCMSADEPPSTAPTAGKLCAEIRGAKVVDVVVVVDVELPPPMICCRDDCFEVKLETVMVAVVVEELLLPVLSSLM